MNRTRASVNALLFRGMHKLRELLGSVGRFFSDNEVYRAPRQAT